ncbi:PREDICTED: uncharacterized protein LOC108781687, partial [Cyphomyrmex costatus]|uniref:uncharacterized protein LOC108781687 n=1 Tax=Cyphomyrmex costatus TaxID=456900 RepID=UPI0008523E5F
METPDESWEEHSVLKIYTTCSNYTTAQEKLKLAELLSDVNFDGGEEKFKKSRKIRAAKTRESSYSTEDTEDDDSDEEITSNLPKAPTEKRTDVYKQTSKKVTQSCKDSQRTINENIELHDRNKNVSRQTSHTNETNWNTDSNQDLQRAINKNAELHDRNKNVVSSRTSHTNITNECVVPRHTSHINTTIYSDSNQVSDAQYAATLVDADHHKNIFFNRQMLNYTGGSDFERFVIQKFQHLELKVSNVQKQNQKILD